MNPPYFLVEKLAGLGCLYFERLRGDLKDSARN
jgi:hypothetical protein